MNEENIVNKLKEAGINTDNDGELKVLNLYDFMNDPRFLEMETAVDYIDWFMTVKQDVLIQLDSVNCGIVGAELNLAQLEANELLNTDFKKLYDKANERVEKAHMKKTFKELYEQLEGYKYQRKVLNNQLDILNDMIKANQILLEVNQCKCESEDNECSF